MWEQYRILSGESGNILMNNGSLIHVEHTRKNWGYSLSVIQPVHEKTRHRVVEQKRKNGPPPSVKKKKIEEEEEG